MTIVAPIQQADTVLARDYERLKPDILRTVRGKLASSGVRFDDLDLDAFYNQAWHGVHTKLAEGERIENVSGLLVTIAQRRALDEFRTMKMEARVDSDLLDGRRVDLDLAAKVDDHMRLRHFIEGMRENLHGREREAAALCYVQDYSRPEAAQAMGIKPRRMEKLMDGVSKKVGAFVGEIQRDEWCDARHSMIKAYALGLLDPEGERYALAAEHLDSCSACRRDVIRMRGIASLSPPVPLMMAALVGAGAGAGGGIGHWFFHGGSTAAKAGTVAAAGGTAVAATVAAIALTGSPKKEPILPGADADHRRRHADADAVPRRGRVQAREGEGGQAPRQAQGAATAPAAGRHPRRRQHPRGDTGPHGRPGRHREAQAAAPGDRRRRRVRVALTRGGEDPREPRQRYMNAPSLFAEIALTEDDDVRAAHRRAIAHGLDITRTEVHFECHALMCLSIEHMLTVALAAEGFQNHASTLGDPSNPILASQLRRICDASASSVLLLSRALEAHASDTGREPGAWQDDAVRAASTVLAAERGRPGASEVARSAILEVSSGLLRIAHSRMVVPRHLATAIGRMTAIFALAEELLARAASRGRVSDFPRGWEGLLPAGAWPQLMVQLSPRERAELHGILLGLAPDTRGRVVDELLAQMEWMSFGTAMLVALFRSAGPTGAAQGRYRI